MTEEAKSALERDERALSEPFDGRFELTLFVSGASDLAARAISNARLICDSKVVGVVALVVVDVQADPAALIASGVLATPTLVRNRPLPVRRVVGDLSHTDKVLHALGLPTEPSTMRSGAPVAQHATT